MKTRLSQRQVHIENRCNGVDRALLQSFAERGGEDPDIPKWTDRIEKMGLEAGLFSSQESREDWFNFSLRLPPQQASDQGKTGRCWIHASLNVLRAWFRKTYQTQEIFFSANYIAFYDLLEKANSFLEFIIQTRKLDIRSRLLAYRLEKPVQDAGQWSFFVELVQKYGLVPYAAMPETRSSAETGEMIALMSNMLRADARELREAETDPEELEEKKASMLYQIYRLLVICLGEPPADFEPGPELAGCGIGSGGRMSPREFYDRYITLDLQDYVPVINAPCADKPYYRMYTVRCLGCLWEGEPVRYLNLPMEELRELALCQLRGQEPVWFGCDSRISVDREHGILDLQNYRYDQLGYDVRKLSKGEALDYQSSQLTHAMVIQGAAFADGAATRWYVENSYGTSAGNQGYLSVSDEWFDRCVYEIVVKRKYLETCFQKCQGGLIELAPWDPIGALARVN